MSTTHFGFKTLDETEKADAVAKVFSSVAKRYDLMNDLMSLGLQRLWKRHAIQQMNVVSGMKVLDIAGGTGDFACAFADQVGPEGEVWLTDINNAMLTVGRQRLLNKGKIVPIIQCDAEQLPFPNAYFDRIIVAFGLRNMTRQDIALAEMHRVLRPGGQAFILEFSKIEAPLQKVYDLYSFNVLPWLGKKIVNDADSYRYLAESIRMHPDQMTLKRKMEAQGFVHVSYENLSAGIVALHRGFRQHA